MKTYLKHYLKLPYFFFILVLLLLFSDSLYASQTNLYTHRREQLRAALGIGGKAVLFAGPNGQPVNKNFYYLTGVREPDAILLMFPVAADDYLFIADINNAERVSELSLASGIIKIMPLNQFDTIFGYLYPWQNYIFYPIPLQGTDYGYETIQRIMSRYPHFELKDLLPPLIEMRMVKSSEEIAIMQRAIDITAAGLYEAIRQAEPGMYEYELEEIIEGTFRSLGSERLGFDSIIGSGPNSVILHYQDNTRKTEPGDVVVMDVGAEYSEYTGDLTRTIPISGKFSQRQREIYSYVLEAQQRVMELCRPGITIPDLDTEARQFIERMGYGQYFYPRISHSLGLDVHDPWFSPAALVPGMIITVEPGIYIPEENLGIRIEDDVIVTEYGCSMLSAALPRTINDIELLMQGKMDKTIHQKIMKLQERWQDRQR